MSRITEVEGAAFETSKHPKSRVSTACDRCRLKKSRCDGKRPCNRCTADNQICRFGGGGRIAENKSYPKGYVDLLLYQQRLLVKAVQVMYRQGHTELAGDYATAQSMQLRIHDILDRLGVLSAQSAPDDPLAPEDFHFEEDPLQMQLNLSGTSSARSSVTGDSMSDDKRDATQSGLRPFPNTLSDLPVSNMALPSIQATLDWKAMPTPGPSVSPPSFFDPYSFPSPDPLLDGMPPFSDTNLTLNSSTFNSGPAETLDQQTLAAIEYLRKLRNREQTSHTAKDAISSGFCPTNLLSPTEAQSTILSSEENTFMRDAPWDDDDYM